MKTETNDYDLLRKLGSNEQDEIGNLAQEIVETLEREICQRETAWHDIELMAVVEEILRRVPAIAALVEGGGK